MDSCFRRNDELSFPHRRAFSRHEISSSSRSSAPQPACAGVTNEGCRATCGADGFRVGDSVRAGPGEVGVASDTRSVQATKTRRPCAGRDRTMFETRKFVVPAKAGTQFIRLGRRDLALVFTMRTRAGPHPAQISLCDLGPDLRRDDGSGAWALTNAQPVRAASASSARGSSSTRT